MEDLLEKAKREDNIICLDPELLKQYIFLNCFVISSDRILTLYGIARIKQKNSTKKIEVYFTPEFLYKIHKKDLILQKINENEEKFYYLKEHIFYYKYLLNYFQEKKSKSYNNSFDNSNINEISYRVLINRLYLLHDYKKNYNYGITKIFGVPRIYSIIESNIIEQMINMEKLNYGLLI